MLNLQGNSIGIVCVGGGGAGVIQAGMLKAFDDAFGWNTIDSISGASVGSLNAAMFAQGRVKELTRVWQTIKRKDVYKIFTTKGILNVFNGQSFLDATPLHALIQKHVNASAIRRSPVKLFILCTQNDTGEAVWATNDTIPLHDYLKGSSAIPVVFPEVYTPDGWLVDGGVNDNSPTTPLAKRGVDIIYILHAHPKRIHTERSRALNRRAAIKRAITTLYLANQNLDIKRIQDVNELVAKGLAAPHQKHIELIDVYPEWEVGTLEFNPKLAHDRILHGYERAYSVIG